MPRAEKFERVTALKERIEGADALLLTEYRGLTVGDVTALRRSLAEGGASFAVVKNTLMKRAADEAGLAGLESLLEGPSAVAFVSGDAVAAAKKVVAAAKLFPALVLKGGFMEGRILSADEAKALADLESREAMLSKIAGLMKGEMSRAAAMFVSAQARFLSLLEAYREKMPGPEAEGAAATVEEPDAVETPDAAGDDVPTTEQTEGSVEAEASQEEGSE